MPRRLPLSIIVVRCINKEYQWMHIMKFSVINYLMLGLVAFVVFFGVQVLIVPHYLPAPTINDLSHPSEIIGTYTYFKGSRTQSNVWVNNMRLYCGAGAFGHYTCLKYTNNLPQRSPIVVRVVNLKTAFGYIALAMNIKSSGRELFSQTPAHCVDVWRNENTYWFSVFSLIFAILVVGFTYIFLTQDKVA